MSSTLTQTQLTALFVAASTTDGSTPGGAYNEVGTSTGEVTVGRISSDYEKAIVSVIALAEFLVANTADPSSSTANQLKAGQQRKALKEMLAKTAMRIKTAEGTTDDRATYGDALTTKMIAQYNYDNRPDAF